MGIGEIAAPQVEADNAFAYTDLGIERTIEPLINIVCLCPEDLSGTSILGGGAELVDPAATQQTRIIQTDIHGVARSIGNGLSGEVLRSIVIIAECGSCVAIVGISGQAVSDAPA